MKKGARQLQNLRQAHPRRMSKQQIQGRDAADAGLAHKKEKSDKEFANKRTRAMYMSAQISRETQKHLGASKFLILHVNIRGWICHTPNQHY